MYMGQSNMGKMFTLKHVLKEQYPWEIWAIWARPCSRGKIYIIETKIVIFLNEIVS